MDGIARALEMDPAEVRRRNLIPAAALPYRTPTGRLHNGDDYHHGFERVLELAGYSELRKEQARLLGSGQLPGIGISTTVDASGSGPSGTISVRPGYETSKVQVDSTGHVTVFTGSSPRAKGHETTFAQTVADELAVPLEDISLVYGNTNLIAQGTGTRASRSIVVGGCAVVVASRKVRDKALKPAAWTTLPLTCQAQSPGSRIARKSIDNQMSSSYTQIAGPILAQLLMARWCSG